MGKDEGESVKVAVRVRPFNGREKDRNAKLIIDMVDAQTIITRPSDGAEKRFTFDYSYWSHDGMYDDDGYWKRSPTDTRYADQRYVFDTVGQDVLDNAYGGFNCSLFAYGQTGSGKSYSMVGYGVNKGIVPISCDEIFKYIDKNQDAKLQFQVTLSMLEIYNEQVFDLFVKKKEKGGLKVRQHPKLGVQVVGLKEVPVGSYEEIDRRIEEATTNRTVAATNMNATSSRAHTVVTIVFKKVEVDKKGPGKHVETKSKINLVDLAGSERAESTGATGDRLKEGAAINLSLSMLGNVIKALAEKSNNPKSKVLVPYRDSKLTQILQDALGGNSKTIMIAALSPADINYEETLSTLRYADRAKQIKNKAIVNIDPTEILINKLKEENAKLMAALQAGGGSLEALQAQGDNNGLSEEEMREKIRAEMAAELEENQRMLEEQQKSWQDKLKDAEGTFGEADKAKDEEKRKRKTVPHILNLNEDPALSNMIVYFFDDGTNTVGRKGSMPQPTIELGGLSIVDKHAVVECQEGLLTLTAQEGAKVTVNGNLLDVGAEQELHHNDNVLFGTSHLYFVVNPIEKEANGLNDLEHSWEAAQEEIARAQGFGSSTKNFAAMSEKERRDALLQDELVRLLPLVTEANSIAQELGKDMEFQVKMINKSVGGKYVTEIAVKAKNTSNEITTMWSSKKFLNRSFLMRELYGKFVEEGAEALDMPQEEDPFWDPPEPVMIGTANVYLDTLSYGLEFDDTLAVNDYKGKEEGIMQVTILPVDKDGNPDDDLFVDSPEELLGRRVDYLVSIPFCRGINEKFQKGIFVKFSFNGEETQSNTVKGTSNPDFNFKKQFTFASMDKAQLAYLQSEVLKVEVWGEQEPMPAGRRKSIAPGAGLGAAADVKRELNQLKLDHQQQKNELNDAVNKAKGSERAMKARVNRLLEKNRMAVKAIDEAAKNGGMKPEVAQQLRKLLASGGISKFRGAARAVQMSRVAEAHEREKSQQPHLPPPPGQEPQKSKGCSIQ